MLFIKRDTSYADVYAGARNMSKYVKDIVAMQAGRQDGHCALAIIFFWIFFGIINAEHEYIYTPGVINGCRKI